MVLIGPKMLGLGRLFKRNAPERRKTALLRRLAELLGPSIGPYFDLGSFQSALERSVWAYRSAYSVASAVSTTKFVTVNTDTGETVEGGKAAQVRDVLRSVNPEQTFIEFLFAWTVHFVIDGEVYIEKVRNRLKETRELYIWNPENVSPIPDKSGKRRIAAYEFTVGGAPIVLPAEDVIPARNYNTRDPYRGFSPIAPVRTEIASDMEAASHNLNLLRRGARHGGILSPAEGEVLNEEELERMVAQLEARNVGGSNAGRPMIMPASFKFFNDAMTNRDADFLNSRKWSREVIAACIGAIPIMVNNLDQGTYTNTEQQQRAFWDGTGKLLLHLFYGSLNEHWVHKEVDPNLSLAPDMVGIDATIDSEKTRTENTRTLKTAGIITANEARARHGYEPIADGDKLDVPLNISPRPEDDIINPQSDKEPPSGGEPVPNPLADGSESVPEPAGRNGAGSFSRNGVKAHRKAQDREAIRQAQTRAVKAAEGKLATRISKALTDQKSKIVEKVKQYGSQSNCENCFGSVEAQARDLMKSMATAILTTIRDSGELHIRRLGGKRIDRYTMQIKQGLDPEDSRLINLLTAFDLDQPQIRAYLQGFFGRHIMAISSATLKELEAIFQESVRAGEGVSELVERIRRLGTFSDARAERIARTESTSAFNLGAQRAFEAAGTPGKSWLTARDEKVRDSHYNAEQETAAQPIEVGLPFTLSGERGVSQLMFPGDPGGPAHEVVNCRCSLVPEDIVTRAVFAAQCRKELVE